MEHAPPGPDMTDTDRPLRRERNEGDSYSDCWHDIDDNEDNDDDLSSVLSDVGLLNDIDFDDTDETNRQFHHLVAPLLLVPVENHPTAIPSINNSGGDDTHNTTGTGTGTHRHGRRTRHHMVTRNNTINNNDSNNNIRRRSNSNDGHSDERTDTSEQPNRPTSTNPKQHHHRTPQQQQQQQRQWRSEREKRHAVDQKLRQRRIDWQDLVLPHCPTRLLPQIQQRDMQVRARQQQQQQQQQHEIVPDVPISPQQPPPAYHHRHWLRQLYEFLLFEYYLTLPAAIAIVFHSIILITVYDLIHELILVLYTDVLPGFYHCATTCMSWMRISSGPLGRLPQPFRRTLGTEFVTRWLVPQYDTMFYIIMFLVGVYAIHLSGYLYWWLSDCDYTILKYDTHNRIRLLRWRQHTNPTIPNNENDTVNVVVSTEVDRKNTTNTLPSHTIGTIRTSEHRPPSAPKPRSGSDHRRSFSNAFVRRFYIVRQYPIVRLILYMTGYFVVYMISQVLVSTIYPYFSQHDRIVPHLPSSTFDKQLYHSVDDDDAEHSLDDALLRFDRPYHAFPCLEQNCREEIERQQRANHELIHAERQYTKARLAETSDKGYWSTFLEQYGEKSIHPLFDTIRNRLYVLDDGNTNNEEEQEEENPKERDAVIVEDEQPLRRSHAGIIVDFQSTPVFDNTGEIVYAFVCVTIGIILLRGYGFIFWEKY